MDQLLTGATAMGFAVASGFFLKFWRQTRDRLFGLFALSFFVLAINRVALAVRQELSIHGDALYWIRFIAFAVILLAIVDKNRSRPGENS